MQHEDDIAGLRKALDQHLTERTPVRALELRAILRVHDRTALLAETAAANEHQETRAALASVARFIAAPRTICWD
jgi:hypothetical protein